MAIEFRNNPYCPGNIQCLKNGKHIASIDKFSKEVAWISIPSFLDEWQILSKMKELQDENSNTGR